MDIGEVMKGRTMILIGIALAVIAIIIYAGFSWGQSRERQKHIAEVKAQIEQKVKEIDADYQAKLAEKDRAIAARELLIAKYKKDYLDIIARLKSKAAEADAVRQPQSAGETKERFGKLGYSPR